MLVEAISVAALALSIAAFVVFVILTFRRPPKVSGAGKTELQSGAADTAKLIEAVAKLAESLAKAGPAIAALLAAIFFMTIASIGSGLFK